MARWLSAAGSRWCSWRRLVKCMLLCLLLPPIYSFYSQVVVTYKKLKHTLALQPRHLHELDQVEQITLLPPYGLKSQTINLNEEFLKESSRARSLFFPNRAFYIVDPRKDDVKNNGFFYPKRVWLDIDGNPIQAHGGSILVDERSAGTYYYWYGEYKDGPTYPAPETGTPRVDFMGVACYSSKDLWAWKFEGIVLAAEENDENHDLHKSKVLERPKVIYNKKSGKYIMWMHVDDAAYNKALVGIATSDSPTGPFEYLYSRRPNGYDSRDMTVFKDDNGMAYLIYSSVKNKELHISPMDEDYLGVTNITTRALIGQHREAPNIFKHDGICYMITSGSSNWLPNEALVHEAESILGPWETIGNPCVGGNKDYRVATFFSKGSFVVPAPGAPPGSFIFMGDTWNPADLRDSRYVWLPITVRPGNDRQVGFPLWSRVSLSWHEKWRLPRIKGVQTNQFPELPPQDEWHL